MKKPPKPEPAISAADLVPDAGPSPDLIVIDDMGPIEHAEVTARPGRITRLIARNGRGKSLFLESVRALGGAKGVKLPKRDNATGGTVSGFGVTITIGIDGSNRRKGNLCLTSIDGTVDIGRIIDPGIEDVHAADLARLKEIVTLLGLKITDEDVSKLLGGRALWVKYCSEIEASGTVDFLAKVKRALEKAARECKSEADELNATVKGTEAVLSALVDHGVDLEYAQGKHRQAVAELSRLQEAQRAAVASAENYRKAETLLAGGGDRQAAVATAQAAVDKAKVEHAALIKERGILEGKLQRIALDIEMKESEVGGRSDTLTAATLAASEYAAVSATLAAGIAAPVPDAVIAAATQAEAAAQTVVADVVAFERHATERETLKTKRTLAAEATARSTIIRATVEKLPDLLADVIRKNVPGIKVTRDLRIAITDHPLRGTCFFAELSAGERSRKVIELAAAAAAGQESEIILALGQEAWEGLDYEAKDSMAEVVAATGLRVVTGEAEQNPDAPDVIRVEEYEPGKNRG